MSLGAVIQRPDRKPLGNAEEVKIHLSDAFPGLNFVFVEEAPRIAVPRFSLMRLMLWLGTPRYPHWYADMQADGFAVVLTFDAKPAVRAVNATLYGLGTAGAEPYFARLSEKTGWQVEFGWASLRPRWFVRRERRKQ
jgi:hypothetical protein